MSKPDNPAVNEFRCALCNVVFEKGWNDDEAEAELDETFPGWVKEDCEVVCDDCFTALLAERKPSQ